MEGEVMEQILIGIATQVLGAALVALATAVVNRFVDRYVASVPA